MGQVLHGSATTTHAIRAAIQRSKATAKELAERHGINPKTVAKWKKRTFVHDAPMGPKDPRSTVLTVEEEAIAVAFRKHTLLPLDDCLYALQATIPHLTRSSLHRCYQRRRARGARYRATASAGCRIPKATSLPRKRSRHTLSASSISTSPRSRPRRESSSSSWPSTGPANSPSPSSLKKQTA